MNDPATAGDYGHLAPLVEESRQLTIEHEETLRRWEALHEQLARETEATDPEGPRGGE